MGRRGHVANGQVALPLQLVDHLGEPVVHPDPRGGLGELLSPVQVRADPQADQGDQGEGRDEQHGEQLRPQSPVP